MKRTLCLFGALMALSAVPAFAADAAVENNSIIYDVNGNEAMEHWQFLGCVRYADHCRDSAYREGFRFHRTELDWRRCGRSELACWAAR